MQISIRKFEEMKSVLMNPAAAMPKIDPYYVFKNNGDNVTVLSPINYDSEFNKTFGHYHKPHFPEKYVVLHGQGAVLMQKLSDPTNYCGNVSEVVLVKAEEGQEILIPKGWGHCLINLGSSFLVTQDNWNTKNAEHEYKAIEQNQGMAYYIIHKSTGGFDFVRNSKYSNLPDLKLTGF